MWVDPMRDMAAAVVAVDHGWKTNTQVASDLGGDYTDNIAEIKRETASTAGTVLEKTPGGNPAQRAGLILGALVESEKGSERHEKES